eukprot:6466289-Amphidinium_carterae.1
MELTLDLVDALCNRRIVLSPTHAHTSRTRCSEKVKNEAALALASGRWQKHKNRAPLQLQSKMAMQLCSEILAELKKQHLSLSM